MAAVAREPSPTPTRVFLRSTLRLRWRDATAALASAWHLAFSRTSPIPALARIQSLVVLLVFTVVVSAGGTLAAAGAARVMENPREPGQVDPVVLPSVDPWPNVSQLPSVLVLPEPSPSGLERALERGVATEEDLPAADKGEQAREGQPRAGSGSGDKASSPALEQKRKQSSKPAPAGPNAPQQFDGEATRTGAGSGDQAASQASEQLPRIAVTPKPDSLGGNKTQQDQDEKPGRKP